MSMWLRQSTASQEILLGKFVDSTDAVTAETGLSIANTDIKIWKEGATTLADKTSGGATHISGGLYYAVLDATDTDTLGKLEVNVAVSGALAVRREFMVLPAVVYDAMVLGTDNLDVNVAQWLGTAPATPTVAGVPEVDVTHLLGTAWLTPGTAGTPDVNVKLISDDATAANNAESFFDGTGYAGTNNVIPTVTTLTGHTAQTGDSYAIVNSGTHGNAALKTLIDAVDNFVDTEITDIQSRLPAALVSGKIDASVSDVTAAGLTDFWTAASATYGLTLATMGRMVHNGGAAAFDGTVTGTPSSTAIELATSPDAPSSTNDFYADMVAYIDSGTGAGQARPVLSYNGTTKVLTFDEPFAVVPSAADRIVIRASHSHPKSQIADAVYDEALSGHSTAGTAGKAISDIVADTNELQADWANGGRLDVILDARSSQSSVDDLPTNAELATALGTADDAVIAVLGAPVGASLSADIAAVKAGTLTAASKAKIDRSAGAICTGTVGVGSTTTSIITSALSPSGGVADQFKGRIVIFDDATTTAALRGQATDITASSNAALAVLTVTALTTAPASTDTFTIT